MSIAVKDACGQYEIKEFSLFKIDKLNEGLDRLHIKFNKTKEMKIKIECPICGEYHSYSYNIGELVKRDVIIGGCESIGYPLFYIGNKNNVEWHINRFNEINKQVYAMI
jgi:hypothetical protein